MNNKTNKITCLASSMSARDFNTRIIIIIADVFYGVQKSHHSGHVIGSNPQYVSENSLRVIEKLLLVVGRERTVAQSEWNVAVEARLFEEILQYLEPLLVIDKLWLLRIIHLFWFKLKCKERKDVLFDCKSVNKMFERSGHINEKWEFSRWVKNGHV